MTNINIFYICYGICAFLSILFYTAVSIYDFHIHKDINNKYEIDLFLAFLGIIFWPIGVPIVLLTLLEFRIVSFFNWLSGKKEIKK